MNIVFLGQFTDASGYGNAARGYLKSLDYYIIKNNLDINLKIHTLGYERQNEENYNQEEANLIEKYEIKHLSDLEYKKLLEDDYIFIWHQTPTFYEKVKEHINPRFNINSTYYVAKQLLDNANKNINISAWETDKAPTTWCTALKETKTSSIITASTQNQNLLQSAVSIPCYLIPHLIEAIKTNTQPTKQHDKFTILSLFQWTYRKAPEKLIIAYIMEFRNHDDVQFLIKSYSSVLPSSDGLENQEKSLRMAIKSATFSVPGRPGDTEPPISLSCDMMSPERIHELYRDVDLFALASRGEGFGLPIAEALINKTPVLVSAEGGHTDFIDSQAAFFVEGHWEPCIHAPAAAGYHYNQNLFEPHTLSIRKQLRNAYNLWKSGKLSAKGKKGYNYIKRSGYDRATIGKKLVDILKKEYETINA